jgi:hypothetical protein
MKQEILLEVSRIHEIMGVIKENKEIIFEAAGPPKSQLVEKFFELLGLSAEKDLDMSWKALQQKVSSGAASTEEKEVEGLIKDFLRSKPDIGSLNPQRFSKSVEKYSDELYEMFFKAEGVRAKFLEAFEKVNPAFSKVKEVLTQPVNFDKMYKMIADTYKTDKEKCLICHSPMENKEIELSCTHQYHFKCFNISKNNKCFYCGAKVKNNNTPSIKIFLKTGFKFVEENDNVLTFIRNNNNDL